MMPAGHSPHTGQVQRQGRRPGRRASFEHGDETPGAIRKLGYKLLGVGLLVLAMGAVWVVDRFWEPPSPIWAEVVDLGAIELPEGVPAGLLHGRSVRALSTEPGGPLLEGMSAYDIGAASIDLDDPDVIVPFRDVGLMGETRRCVFRVTGNESEADGATWVELEWSGDER